MKNKSHTSLWVCVFFALTVLAALLSWTGSIYNGDAVQSLLSGEGIRHALNHVLADYVQCPALGIVLVLLMGLGIGHRAGLYNALHRALRRDRPLSGKERRALSLAGVVGCIYAVAVLLSVPFLRSVTGSLLHSPFQNGLPYILSFGLGLMGMVYGYAANRYRTLSEVVGGMSSLIASRASYFVALFFVVQFFSVLTYTGLMQWAAVPDAVVEVCYTVCCFLPLFF